MPGRDLISRGQAIRPKHLQGLHEATCCVSLALVMSMARETARMGHNGVCRSTHPLIERQKWVLVVMSERPCYVQGHADCLKFMQSFNLPMLVLGGGGYKINNVARCWAYETGNILGEKLHNPSCNQQAQPSQLLRQCLALERNG